MWLVRLPNDLDLIQNKSEFSWENLVSLVKLKEEKSESKMKNLSYEKYLTLLDVRMAKTVEKVYLKEEYENILQTVISKDSQETYKI